MAGTAKQQVRPGVQARSGLEAIQSSKIVSALLDMWLAPRAHRSHAQALLHPALHH